MSEITVSSDIHIEWEMAAASDVGVVRTVNEDTVATHLLDAESSPTQTRDLGKVQDVLLVVADGMGGHAAGEVASSRAVEVITQIFLNRRTPDKASASTIAPGEMDVQQQVAEAVEEANRVVFEELSGINDARPGTTLTFCLSQINASADDISYYIGHVGDSRAYKVGAQSIEQITDDDSWTAEAVRQNQMTQEQALKSPFRNRLTKAIGGAPQIKPGIYGGKWPLDDVMVLCSDGLTEYVSAAEIAQEFQANKNLQAVCERLIELANQRGGSDNISVVAARPITSPIEQPTQEARPIVNVAAVNGELTESSGSQMTAALPEVQSSIHQKRPTTIVAEFRQKHFLEASVPVSPRSISLTRNKQRVRTGIITIFGMAFIGMLWMGARMRSGEATRQTSPVIVWISQDYKQLSLSSKGNRLQVQSVNNPVGRQRGKADFATLRLRSEAERNAQWRHGVLQLVCRSDDVTLERARRNQKGRLQMQISAVAGQEYSVEGCESDASNCKRLGVFRVEVK